MTKRLHVDHETKSVVDLKKVGVDVYFSHPSTEILMTAYAFDDGPVEVWEAHKGPMPDELIAGYKNPNIKKCAWNAGFERTGLEKKYDLFIPFEQWEDPSVGSRYMSMPGGLGDVGPILGVPPELLKSLSGTQLIKLFSEPLRVKQRKQATDENTLFAISPIGEPAIEYEWATPLSHPKEWAEFVKYCQQDVVAERAIQDRTDAFPLTETDQKMWYLDQKINRTGIAANRGFAKKCLNLAIKDKNAYVDRLKVLTGLENPVSNQQMLSWVQLRGYPNNSLRAEPVATALVDEEVKLTEDGRKALTMLKYAKKTSYTKLEAINNALSADDRLRDQFVYMGSPRAGRWSGRNVQMQNMARSIKALERKGALDKAIAFINAEDYLGIQEFFRNPKTKEVTPVIEVVTSCIRSVFVAGPGMRLDVCDLNAIENRVIGWVAGEDKILQVFRDGKCPYLDFATRWFNIPYEVIKAAYDDENHPDHADAKFKRQISKPAVLGCGYRQAGGEWGEDFRTGDRIKKGLWGYAEKMQCPMTKDQAHQAVGIFRAEYKKVVNLWYDSERAVIRCLKTGSTEWIGPTQLVWCDRRKRKNGTYILRIHLPSGRCLHYLNARVEERENTGRDGTVYKKDTIIYEGIDSTSSDKRWKDIFTHGGKIVENIVQAISRDILVHAMLLADELGFNIVGHVHDEIITENPDNEEGLGLEDLKWCMEQVPSWAPGLPLKAAGFSGYYYKK